MLLFLFIDREIMSELKREDILSINQNGWNKAAPLFYAGTALPEYGPLVPTENDLQLIPNLNGGKVLELGCGSGHSLVYLLENRNARELWGLDISEEQIRMAQDLLQSKLISANLLASSMDENHGIPKDYFDLVIAIYALGCTPDLAKTLQLIHSYLRPGVMFIFSWEHPMYQSLSYESSLGKYVFENSYLQEGPVLNPAWKGVEIVINHRKLSTYLNAIIQAGLLLDQMIEPEPHAWKARKQDIDPSKWYNFARAQLMSTTFIVKSHKAN